MLRKRFLRLISHTLNPLTLRLGRTTVSPISIIRHTGRKSGKVFETPIIVAPSDRGFVIELTYGPDVDWHKNIVAAGGGTLIWRGRAYVVERIEPCTPAEDLAAFPLPQRILLRLLRRKHFELLVVANASMAAMVSPA
jgi:deazaflavin-dependent oxidoreductase (nitroreductase family)